MAKPFLDTNIIVYALAENDPRAERAGDLLAAGATISVQVLNEFISLARTPKFDMPWQDIREAEAIILSTCRVESLTIDTHSLALDIAERYKVHVYDALIIAAAINAGCDVLYSEDMQNGMAIEDRLTIVNPFPKTD